MNFNEFNARNLRLRPAMSRMLGDIMERDRRVASNEIDPYDEGQERTWEARMPARDEYNERRRALLDVGIKVRTRVRSVSYTHLTLPTKRIV